MVLLGGNLGGMFFGGKGEWGEKSECFFCFDNVGGFFLGMKGECFKGRCGFFLFVKNSIEMIIVECFFLNVDGMVLKCEYIIIDFFYFKLFMIGLDEVMFIYDKFRVYECEDFMVECGLDSLGGIGVM